MLSPELNQDLKRLYSFQHLPLIGGWNLYVPPGPWTQRWVGSIRPSKAILDNCFTGPDISIIWPLLSWAKSFSNIVNIMAENKDGLRRRGTYPIVTSF